MVAVVTLLRVLATMSKWGRQVDKLSNVRGFIGLQSREVVTSSTKGKSANVSSEKW